MSEILDCIFKMTQSEQLTLIQIVLDNVNTNNQDEDAWLTEDVKKELDRRIQSIDDGTAQLYSWNEVQKTIKDEYGFTAAT